jgi:DNA modification methylase
MSTSQYTVALSNGLLPAMEGIPSVINGVPDGCWDFASQDTQYATHGIHTYVAAMIPALARQLIDTYAPTRGTVLDPFCGGGAVLVETIRSGRQAIGRDINALAVLVSRAKTTHIEAEEIRITGAMVLAQAMEYQGHRYVFLNPIS